MTISNLDSLIASFQPARFIWKLGSSNNNAPGTYLSMWAAIGVPGPGSFDTTLNGVTLSSTSALPNGAMPFSDAAGGQATYLARLAIGGVGQSNTSFLCDRLWHNGGITANSAGSQSITSPTWPARDANGATSGDGVLLALEVSVAMGAGTPTVSVGYTNSAGTSGRTATLSYPTFTSPGLGNTFPLTLQAGDAGVRSVQSLQFASPWASGTCNLVAYRQIAPTNSQQAAGVSELTPFSGGMPQLYNGSVLFFYVQPVNAGAGSISGTMTLAQG